MDIRLLESLNCIKDPRTYFEGITVDFADITKGNSLISDGEVANESNRNKDSYGINLDLVDITNESTLNLSHNFLRNTPNTVHIKGYLHS